MARRDAGQGERARFFSTDSSYIDYLARYNKTDGILALAVYAALFALYYLMGALFVQHGLYLGVPINLLVIGLCVGLVHVRGQSLASIGVTRKRLRSALLGGLAIGAPLTLVANVIPSLFMGGRLIAYGQAAYNIFYYFIVIALTEEIVFRGYIQTRIYGLIRRDRWAISVTGLLFYAIHLPFQMQVSGMRLSLINMAIIFALHILHNALYRKYNSIAAPTVLHGLLDWGGNLLVS